MQRRRCKRLIISHSQSANPTVQIESITRINNYLNNAREKEMRKKRDALTRYSSEYRNSQSDCQTDMAAWT